MLVLVMEYAQGGSLKSAIDKGRLGGNWLVKTRIAREVARCLEYIHHQKVLHHDLKSAKVLLTEHMQAKPCDFGQAMVRAESTLKSSSIGGDDLKGALRWRTPELFGRRPRYSTKSDMFALGMIMWEIAAQHTAQRVSGQFYRDRSCEGR